MSSGTTQQHVRHTKKKTVEATPQSFSYTSNKLPFNGGVEKVPSLSKDLHHGLSVVSLAVGAVRSRIEFVLIRSNGTKFLFDTAKLSLSAADLHTILSEVNSGSES